MNEKQFQEKLFEYYSIIKNPKYKTKDWIIADSKLYLSLKNKLNITSVLFINVYPKETIIVIESKKEYYAIKYNGNFICLRRSETEYGLVTGEYELLAVNEKVLKEISEKTLISFDNMCKLFNWKLSKKAKEELEYKYLTKV
jgi:hypothetical protein